MVILANSDLRELGAVRDANLTVDLNGNRNFSLQIARSYWHPELTFSSLIYILGTEYGGIIGEVLTDTTLDYVELKGLSWRGRLAKKIIEPPAGSDYKTVSGELHTVMKSLIEPEFDGLFVVSAEDTGVTVSNYQFDRYCTLLDGLNKMLKSKIKIPLNASYGHCLRRSWLPSRRQMTGLPQQKTVPRLRNVLNMAKNCSHMSGQNGIRHHHSS